MQGAAKDDKAIDADNSVGMVRGKGGWGQREGKWGHL